MECFKYAFAILVVSDGIYPWISEASRPTWVWVGRSPSRNNIQQRFLKMDSVGARSSPSDPMPSGRHWGHFGSSLESFWRFEYMLLPLGTIWPNGRWPFSIFCEIVYLSCLWNLYHQKESPLLAPNNMILLKLEICWVQVGVTLGFGSSGCKTLQTCGTIPWHQSNLCLCVFYQGDPPLPPRCTGIFHQIQQV